MKKRGKNSQNYSSEEIVNSKINDKNSSIILSKIVDNNKIKLDVNSSGLYLNNYLPTNNNQLFGLFINNSHILTKFCNLNLTK